VERNLSNALDESLRGDYQWAAAMADERPDGTLHWFDDERNFSEETPWLQVWSGGRVIFRTATAERNLLTASEALAAHPVAGIVAVPGARAPVRVLTAESRVYGRPVIIQVAKSEALMRRQLYQLVAFFALGLPLGVAAAGIGGYALARRALMPIERMTERARTITAERLHDRLPVDNPHDELGSLSRVFNETLSRLESSFDQMRRFTADVSHQLRTPLTAIRSVGEVGLREPRAGEAYRQIIGSMLEEADRLGTLVDRLLLLSRTELGQTRLSPSVIDLDDLAQDVVAQLGVLAEEKRQDIVVESTGRPYGLGDRVVLRQSLMNLVDNAIKYSPLGGRVQVRVWESETSAMVEVNDDGPGVASEVRTRVFDRFYRARTSPADGEVPGSGLGLAIARWAVEISGGRLTLEPTTGAGSRFRVTLPRGEAPRS